MTSRETATGLEDEGEVFALINDIRGYLLGVLKCGEEIEARADPLNQDPEFNAIMTLTRSAHMQIEASLLEVVERAKRS